MKDINTCIHIFSTSIISYWLNVEMKICAFTLHWDKWDILLTHIKAWAYVHICNKYTHMLVCRDVYTWIYKRSYTHKHTFIFIFKYIPCSLFAYWVKRLSPGLHHVRQVLYSFSPIIQHFPQSATKSVDDEIGRLASKSWTPLDPGWLLASIQQILADVYPSSECPLSPCDCNACSLRVICLNALSHW